MFGLIVSGRPLLTDYTTISPTQVAFTLPSSPPFNHLVVFLLPNSPSLPPDHSAAVYIQLPPKQDFALLGALSVDKPSAIFRTRGVGAAGMAGVVDEDAMVDSGEDGGKVVVGISLEPTASVQQALERLKADATSRTGLELVKATPPSVTSVSTKVLAQRIIGNAFNFLASFGSDVIPLKAFEEWWKKFERKIEMDPTFLEREGAA
jgi:protein Hikeshi